MEWYLIAIIVVIVVLLAYYAHCTTRVETLNVSFSTFVDPKDKDAIRAALRSKDRAIVDYVSVGAMGNFFILRGPNEVINAYVLIPDIPRRGGPSDVNIAVFSKSKNMAHMLDHDLNPIVGVKDGALIVGNTYNKLWNVRSVKMQRAAIPAQLRKFAKPGPKLTLRDMMTVNPSVSRDMELFKCTLYRTARGAGGEVQRRELPVSLQRTDYSNVFYSSDGQTNHYYIVIIGSAIYTLSEYSKTLILRPGLNYPFDDKWAMSAFSMQMKV